MLGLIPIPSTALQFVFSNGASIGSKQVGYGDSSGKLTSDAGFQRDVSAVTMWLNEGRALGAPTGTPAVATNGAGSLNATYSWGYTETDNSGETTISTVATLTPANNTVQVTMPLPRRGVNTRKLYRTKANAPGVYYLLHNFGSGNGYFQTVFNDNVADGSLGVGVPQVDSTNLHSIELAQGVKFVRTHPSIAGAADLTIVTADPSNGNAYGIDCYGPYFGRTVAGATFGSLVTGTSAKHISFNQIGITDVGGAYTECFKVDYDGKLTITPIALSSGTQTALTITGSASTSQTASTEINDISLNFSSTLQWATTVPATTQRTIYIQARTYDCTAGSQTIANADTLNISGAPAGTGNVTITVARGISVGATTDMRNALGTCEIGFTPSGNAGQMYIAHTSTFTNANYALTQTSGGLTAVNAASGQSVSIRISNASKLTVNSSSALFASGCPVTAQDTTDATSKTTGALISSGGLSATKNGIFGEGVHDGVTSTATAAGTTTLTNASTGVQIFTGSTTQTLQLPAANLFGAGISVTYTVINRSTGTVTAQRAGSDTINAGSTTFAISTVTTTIFNSDGVSAWYTK